MAEVAKWRAAASVECRATMVWRTLAQTSASVVMAEEFNAPWRYLPLPDPGAVSGRRYVSARALDTPRARGRGVRPRLEVCGAEASCGSASRLRNAKKALTLS